VLMEYGTGAIMAVPAHDKRDFEFATEFKLPIREVVRNSGESAPRVAEDGVLVIRGEFDGLCVATRSAASSPGFTPRVLHPQVQYHAARLVYLAPALLGPAIPIIYCDRCGPVGVPEQDLPVLLPLIETSVPMRPG